MSYKDELIAHLQAERDEAREQAGVYKYWMEHYCKEMQIFLRQSEDRKEELQRLREEQA